MGGIPPAVFPRAVEKGRGLQTNSESRRTRKGNARLQFTLYGTQQRGGLKRISGSAIDEKPESRTNAAPQDCRLMSCIARSFVLGERVGVIQKSCAGVRS